MHLLSLTMTVTLSILISITAFIQSKLSDFDLTEVMEKGEGPDLLGLPHYTGYIPKAKRRGTPLFIPSLIAQSHWFS